MVHTNAAVTPPGVRIYNLKRSFKVGARPLLTAFSRQDVFKAFPAFSELEKERLYRMFIQVIKSLHNNIEEAFEAVCEETQVGSALDTIEKLVEEQSLDILSTDALNVGEIKETLSRMKKDEIHYLADLLEKAEKQHNLIKAQIESLRKVKFDTLAAADAISKAENQNDLTKSMVNAKANGGILAATDVISKLRSWNSNYEKLLSG